MVTIKSDAQFDHSKGKSKKIPVVLAVIDHRYGRLSRSASSYFIEFDLL